MLILFFFHLFTQAFITLGIQNTHLRIYLVVLQCMEPLVDWHLGKTHEVYNPWICPTFDLCIWLTMAFHPPK